MARVPSRRRWSNVGIVLAFSVCAGDTVTTIVHSISVHLDAKKSRENLEGEMIGGNERNFEMEMNKMECDGRRRSTRLGRPRRDSRINEIHLIFIRFTAHSSRLRRIDLPDSALDATTVTVMSSTDSTLPPLLRDETRIARLYAMCSDGNVEMEDGEVSDGRSRPTVAKRVGDGAKWVDDATIERVREMGGLNRMRACTDF
jgi:hypothetical protein